MYDSGPDSLLLGLYGAGRGSYFGNVRHGGRHTGHLAAFTMYPLFYTVKLRGVERGGGEALRASLPTQDETYGTQSSSGAS